MTTNESPATNAQSLRKNSTVSEGLLWSILRAKQLCGLKFRRQYPAGPFIADFACVSQKLIIEIDGGYHDHVVERDLDREAFLRQQGWDVIRFTDKEVEEDAEAVARAIARHVGLEYEFRPRKATGSGMKKT